MEDDIGYLMGRGKDQIVVMVTAQVIGVKMQKDKQGKGEAG